MSKERLRSALALAGITPRRLAELLCVDPKSAGRWVTKGTIPHPETRQRIAAHLQLEPSYLWPELSMYARPASMPDELVQFYPRRTAVPAGTWTAIVTAPLREFDLLAYAALPLLESDLIEHLIRRARDGVRVRILLGDPHGQAIAIRASEEGMGDTVAARCALSIGYVKAATKIPGFEVRLHDTTLYTSMYRADDEMLANIHVFGSIAGHSPVLHLRRTQDGDSFDHFAAAYEKVWEQATPINASYQLGGAR